MAGYTLTTFGSLVTALQTRLGTQSTGFWSTTELMAYIVEGLRTWQAFSQFYSKKAAFNTTPGQIYYNISTLITELNNTITDQNIIVQIQTHLMEAISPTSWVGTEQFSYPQVVAAIQKRIDRFKLETGLSLSISETPVAPNEPVVELDDTVIDIRHALWKNRGGGYSLLWRTDEYSLTGATPKWFITAGTPTDFSTTLEQPLSMELSPPPDDSGSVNLITVNSGPILNPSAAPTILGVPDDFCWVIKYGALADLWSAAGPVQVLHRAASCESRWGDGIELARITNFVKLGYQNGVPSFVDSMFELDASSPGWMSATGTPQGIGVNGNIVSTSPVADSGTYSIMFDITPRMVVPTLLTDFVQIGNEFLDVIIDYAQHIAHIKEGIAEINASFQLYKNFAKLAMVENDRLRAASENFDVLSDRSQRGLHTNPRRRSDTDLEELNYAAQNK